MKKLYKINEGLNKRFPNGTEPFQIMTRLAEEVGELAAEVNHFENAGVKVEKHGEPDSARLAKEVMDVLRCALQITMIYGIEAELEIVIQKSYDNMVAEGWITE